jgi:hypothetical protein
MWVFDDENAGLTQEPFVAGTDDIIAKMVKVLPNAEKGFVLIFSATPFPEYQLLFEWQYEDQGGNWYYVEELDMKGWLCPALYKYFETAPKNIYVKFQAK